MSNPMMDMLMYTQKQVQHEMEQLRQSNTELKAQLVELKRQFETFSKKKSQPVNITELEEAIFSTTIPTHSLVRGELPGTDCERVQQDFSPNIIWTEAEWDSRVEETAKNASVNQQARKPGRPPKGQQDLTKYNYIQDTDGNPLGQDYLSRASTYIDQFVQLCSSTGIPLQSPWRTVDSRVQMIFYSGIRKALPYFQLCSNNDKARMFINAHFYNKTSRRHARRQPQNGARQAQTPAVDLGTARFTIATEDDPPNVGNDVVPHMPPVQVQVNARDPAEDEDEDEWSASDSDGEGPPPKRPPTHAPSSSNSLAAPLIAVLEEGPPLPTVSRADATTHSASPVGAPSKRVAEDDAREGLTAKRIRTAPPAPRPVNKGKGKEHPQASDNSFDMLLGDDPINTYVPPPTYRAEPTVKARKEKAKKAKIAAQEKDQEATNVSSEQDTGGPRPCDPSTSTAAESPAHAGPKKQSRASFKWPPGEGGGGAKWFRARMWIAQNPAGTEEEFHTQCWNHRSPEEIKANKSAWEKYKKTASK